MFWAFHRAYSGAKSEDGQEAANNYVESLRKFLGTWTPPPRASREDEESGLNAIGAKPIK